MNAVKNTIEVNEEDYLRLVELVEDSAFLEALRAAGVDNWEGFDEAVRIFNEKSQY